MHLLWLVGSLLLSRSSGGEIVGLLDWDPGAVESSKISSALAKQGILAVIQSRFGTYIEVCHKDAARARIVLQALANELVDRGCTLAVLPLHVPKHHLSIAMLDALRGTWTTFAYELKPGEFIWRPPNEEFSAITFTLNRDRTCLVHGRVGRWDYYDDKLVLNMGYSPSAYFAKGIFPLLIFRPKVTEGQLILKLNGGESWQWRVEEDRLRVARGSELHFSKS